MPGGNIFNFKRFAVDQTGCAMKVGTDGVLLGAWCRIDPSQDKAILDIGTGTGVIALQLAQRTEGSDTFIEAIEIDPVACETARRNFETSPRSAGLKVYHSACQDFAENIHHKMRYDIIVSNPPWFVDSLASPDALRTAARHSSSLSYDDLMRCCRKLLKPRGRISLVLPAGTEAEKMIAAADAHDFRITRRTDVHSTPKSDPKRILLELSRRTASIDNAIEHTLETASLVIEPNGPGTFSAEYRALTRDFYLRF